MALRFPPLPSISTHLQSSPAPASSSSSCTRLAASMASFKHEYTALAWAPILAKPSQTPSSSIGAASGQVATAMDESDTLTLATIRDSLIRQEDSIIFSLIERAQYKINNRTYDANRFSIPGFEGSLVEYMLKETESLHAKVRRFQSPDEHPFFPDLLPAPLLPPLHYPQVLHDCASTININPLIWKLYFDELLPRFSSKGDDGNYGSTAVCDVLCLQALSKRIHYGKFVAEAKFRESPELFESAIRAKDEEALMRIITYEAVEEKVQKRVEEKARTYGQEVDSNGINPSPHYKIEPSQVAHLYGKWVMPLTKKVQVQYLLQRLD
ncbi:hypothetical protein GOP47_0024458 [Adiantum capillus-veneris]|uniref:chorismate mutase n=1 Tax=Adiantum capillus-veneris TaxID=13818 RepID=A0A9D4Z2S2_ADICA|nr:hypothetical protein GOP47_0024458 [Adiantum capillus-veneris]